MGTVRPAVPVPGMGTTASCTEPVMLLTGLTDTCVEPTWPCESERDVAVADRLYAAGVDVTVYAVLGRCACPVCCPTAVTVKVQPHGDAVAGALRWKVADPPTGT